MRKTKRYRLVCVQNDVAIFSVVEEAWSNQCYLWWNSVQD